MDDKIRIATEIDDFIHDCIKKIEDARERMKLLGNLLEEESTGVIFAYAKSLQSWLDDNKRLSFFSTEDATFLRFKQELTERFGLPVMERGEALEYEELLKKMGKAVYTKRLHGFEPN